MENRSRDAHIARRLDVSALGLAGAVVCFLIFHELLIAAPVLPGGQTLDSGLTLINPLFVCLGACAAAVTCMAGNKVQGASIPSAPLFVADVALFMLGHIGAAMSDLVAQQALLGSIVWGFCSGAGFAVLLVLWQRVLCSRSFDAVLVNLGVAFAVGAPVGIACVLSLSSYLQTCVWVAALLLTFASLAMLLTGRGAQAQDDSSALGNAHTAPARQARAYLWVVMVGLFAFSFESGTHWWKYLSSLSGASIVVVLAVAVVAAVFALYGRAGCRVVEFDVLYRVIFPLIPLLIMPDSFFSQLNIDARSVAGQVWMLSVVAFGMMAPAVFCRARNRMNVSSDFTASVGILVSFASLALGIAADSLLGAQVASTFAAPLVTLYAVAAVLSFVLAKNKPSDDAASDDVASTFSEEDFWNEKRDALSESYGLTPRETEILGYLMRGHGVTYVSNMLSISPNTVKTHRSNIYRKFEVSSREELLDKVGAPRE